MPTGIGGELGWWCPSLDNSGNGTTTLTDFAGANNGTLTNFALTGSTSNWVADTEAGGVRALDCDGTNDFVATSFTRTTLPVSLCAFIKPVVTTQFHTLFGDGDLSMYIGNDNRKLRFFSTAGVSTTSDYLVDSVWQHVGYFWDGSNVTFYYNGVAVQTIALANSLAINSLRIGSYFTPPFAFRGRFDDARIFGRDLTSGEWAALATRRGFEPAGGGPINSQSLVRPAGDYRSQSLVVV